MSNGKGGFIGQDGLNAPDPATGVSASGGDTQATVSFTAPSDVGGAAITGYNVQSNNGDGTISPLYDLSLGSYDSKSLDVSGQNAYSPTAAHFNSDGTKIFVLDDNTNDLFQYSLSTAYDVSTGSYDSVNFDVGSQDGTPVGFVFNSDGTKLYMIGSSTDAVYQYSLSSAFDLSTISYDSVSFSVSSQETEPNGIVFNNDGSSMYIVGYTNDTIYQYTLSTPYNLSTASYASKSFSVTSQETAPQGLAFNSDGTKVFVVGYGTDNVFQYSLSTAYDISTASYDSVSFSVASENTGPRDIVFNSDGSKMYIPGSNSQYRVYQYTTGVGGPHTSSPIVVYGLTNGTSYTFNVWAINPFGWSSPSDASGSITPNQSIGLFHNTYTSTTSTNNHIAEINIATTGNATDFGDLSQYRNNTACGSASSTTRGLFMGGERAGGVFVNTIDYVTIASSGDALDFGDLTATSLGSWQLSSATRGVVGGRLGGTSDNRINYVTIATTGNALDFGDMSVIHYNSAGLSSPTRGVYATGPATSSNVIEYITIASTGNGTDFGDLTIGRNNGGGASNSTRGLWYGGETPSAPYNVVDYITIATTGNATDFGDASGNALSCMGLAGTTRAVFARGNSSVIMDYFTISTTGNASDFGDLITGQGHNGAASNSHGGL